MKFSQRLTKVYAKPQYRHQRDTNNKPRLIINCSCSSKLKRMRVFQQINTLVLYYILFKLHAQIKFF